MEKALEHDALAVAVVESDDVRKTALSSGATVQFGRAFPLCIEKHSELPPGERQCRGRVVFEGSFVSDQNSDVAVVEELASSASLRSASHMFDIIGCQQDGVYHSRTRNRLTLRAS